MNKSLLMLLVGLLLATVPARAAEPATATTPCPQANPQQRRARALYEEALVQEATGNSGAAREMFTRLVKEHPHTSFACWAAEHLDLMAAGKGYINKEGRAQFIIGTTSFGAWTGFAIANIAALGDEEFSFSETKAILWGSISGAVAGLVPSIILSADLPMSTGRATMINFGWTWGAWHGLAFSLIPEGDLDTQGMMGLSLGLSALGWGGTFALTHYFDVADGDAALISSAGMWATWVTAAVGALISEDFFGDEQTYIPVLLAGGDAGVAAAALLSKRLDWSAGRVGLINLGGALGALLGTGITLLAEPDSYRTAIGLHLGLSLAGLAAATFFTRNYDEPAPAASGLALFEHTRDGWAVSAPLPQLLASKDGTRQGLGVSLPLVGGLF